MPKTEGRQLRVDILRGLALVVIFVDHLEFAAGTAILSPWTLQGWYWCDAAEVFVFLAGFVCGRSYLKTVEQDGIAACQRKGLQRAGQLYLANLAVLVAIVDLVIMFGPPDGDAFRRLQYDGLNHGWAWVGAMSAAMLYQPLGVDVLTLYIQFVALLPFMLAGWRRWPFLAKIICLEAYAAAQRFVCLNVPRWPIDVFPNLGCGRHFHHVAWNALFFLGALVAIDPIRIQNRAVRRTLFFVCLAGVLTIMATMMRGLSEQASILATLRSWRSSEWCSKVTLGPIRLTAFLMLVYVISTVASEKRCGRCGRILGPLAMLGRNSLLAYSVGLVLVHTSWLLVPAVSPARHDAALLAYEGLGILAMLLAAGVWERRRRTNGTGAALNASPGSAATFEPMSTRTGTP